MSNEECIPTIPHESCIELGEILSKDDQNMYNDILTHLSEDWVKSTRTYKADYNNTDKRTTPNPSTSCPHQQENFPFICLTCVLSRIQSFNTQRYVTGCRSIKNRSWSRTITSAKAKMCSIKTTFFLLCVVMVFVGGSLLFKRNQNAYKLSSAALRARTYLMRGYQLSRISSKAYSRRRTEKPKNSLGNPFNPDKWDNRTANLRKHYVILYWSKIRGHIARLQTENEYKKNQHVWPYTYVGKNCPVICELTNNRSRAKDADAFVVHSRLTDVWDFPPFEYLAPWILQNNENPVYTPALSDPRIMNKFNLLISYRLDSDFPSPIYPMPNLSPAIPFQERLGDVLAVFSKCEVVRTEYMRQLMSYIDVHSYGACVKNKEGLIGLYGQVNGKYVFKDYKLVLTRFYKFSLVFMNQDCDYFVDDRLYHALQSGSVPVYMGTNKIDEFLPGYLRGAIIRVADFNSPKDLANYLRYLSNNETAYNKYLEWKTRGIGDLSNTTIGRWWKPKYPLFCQVCMRLSQGNLHPGLDVDTCKPRTFEDWKLKLGSGDEMVKKRELSRNVPLTTITMKSHFDIEFARMLVLILGVFILTVFLRFFLKLALKSFE